MEFLTGKPGKRQKGMVLALVLIVFLVGSCLCIILLQSAVSGLETSRVYENKTAEFYAADAGIEDARWIIKYDYLDTLLTSPPYKYYDFTSDWTYSTSELINACKTIRAMKIPVPPDFIKNVRAVEKDAGKTNNLHEWVVLAKRYDDLKSALAE